MSGDRLGCHSIQKSPPRSQWTRPRCSPHTHSSVLCLLSGALEHMSPPWDLVMFPQLGGGGGLPVEGGFQVSRSFCLLSLGRQVRYPWLAEQAAQCPLPWEGFHSSSGFFIVSPASVLYKDHAYSDICDNEIVTISDMASLEALEILCFIDSCFSFISWGSVSTHCTWHCWRDWEYCSEVAPAFLGLYSCGKNPQRNTSKMNPYKKDYIPWPSGIYPRDASLV